MQCAQTPHHECGAAFGIEQYYLYLHRDVFLVPTLSARRQLERRPSGVCAAIVAQHVEPRVASLVSPSVAPQSAANARDCNCAEHAGDESGRGRRRHAATHGRDRGIARARVL